MTESMNNKRLLILCLFVGLYSQLYVIKAQHNEVKIWEDTLTLVTYETMPPEINPIFFRNLSYQGASKIIYPYPAQDVLSHDRIKQVYKALYIENEYIKLCVLPEIGGRLFYATDKTNDYEIFYRQHVIKPALIGMTGAWVSGGVEFCVFHHHRASTHMPVDYRLTENNDGSKTIWIGEFEPRHRMRWTIGITLYPAKSYLELSGTLINSTENTNSFLYWANVATHVNDDYQIIFPSSVQFATYHSKNSFAHWPVTTETYNGQDYYKDSIDASWWKNHPQAVSMFAHDLQEGFLAGYDYGKKAGTMHVGNPHIVKGAKLWEWGPGAAFWDTKILTDNDGPYAELMTGAYSDNQPDYSWIKPFEVKKFQQYWYPLRETEGVKHANLQATVNLEVNDDGSIFLAANTTSEYRNADIVLEHSGERIFEKSIDINPAKPFSQRLIPQAGIREQELKLTILSEDGESIISYQPVQHQYNEILPEPVNPPPFPEEIGSNEELYYTGLRIRQFHNARIDPADYFQEALRRDSLDVRCNTVMGIIRKERGDYQEAATYFRRAILRIAKDYTRPRNCEPFYHLGVILKDQGAYEAAIDTLYRSAWDYEFSSAAYFKLAEIYSIQQNYEEALKMTFASLEINSLNINALCLKTSLLRRTEKEQQAMESALRVLEIDKLNNYAFNELQLLAAKMNWIKERVGYREELFHILRDYPENYLELASSYIRSGLHAEAMAVLEEAEISVDNLLNSYPTIYYYLGYLNHLDDNPDRAGQYFTEGMEKSTDYCFPFRLESTDVYETALQYNKEDRNLGWGYNYTYNDIDRAIEAYNSAIAQDPSHSLYYAEIDELYERRGDPIEIRLELLTRNHDYLKGRSDALSREILVLVHAGKYDRAIELLDSKAFTRMEGSADLHNIHVNAHLLRGKSYMAAGDMESALTDFILADSFPENHLIGRDPFYQGNPRIYYYTGLAYAAMEEKVKAQEFFDKAIKQNGIDGEYLFYKAMALQKSGREKEDGLVLESMIDLGQERLQSSGDVDFFAKFGAGSTEKQKKADACRIIGLGYLGASKTRQAKEYLSRSLELDVNQLWSRIYLEEL